MTAQQSVSALRDGDDLAGIYACTRKDRLTARTGVPYLAVELRDRTGTISGRIFRNADSLAGRFERGDLVTVAGRVQRFRHELVAELTEISRASAEAADPALFLPASYRDLDELDGFLEHLAREVYDRRYRALLDAVMSDDDLRRRLRRAPCSRGGHHAYLGGLLEHTVAVTSLAHDLCALHPRLNSDLLLTAAILHDVGRTREFSYGAEFGLTEEGRLLGHLAIGQQLVLERAGGLDADRRLALLHCILSHHGASGTPGGRFACQEAVALYRLNALDGHVKGVLEHGLGSVSG